MPICQHCHHEWTYRDTFRKSFRIKKRCPYCMEINYVTANAQWRMSLFSVPGFILFPFLGAFNVPLMWSIGIAFIIFLVWFGSMPFLTVLCKEREYLT